MDDDPPVDLTLSLAPPGQVQEGGGQQVGPLSLQEIEAHTKCDELKSQIISLPRIQAEFQKAARLYPAITQEITPERAIDHIMQDLITSHRGSAGDGSEGLTRGYPLLQKLA